MKTPASNIRTFDDIVFEKRNKQYGAYALRQDYNARMLKALAFMGFLLLALVVVLTYKWKEDVILPIIKGTVPMITIEDPIVPEEVKPETPKQNAAPVEMHKEPTYDPNGDKKLDPVPVNLKSPVGPIDQKGIFGPVSPIITPPGKGLVPDSGSIKAMKAPDNGIISIAQEMPEFVGGQPALMKFIAKQAAADNQWVDMGLTGTVYVQFVVNTDGSISDVECVRTPYEYLKKIAIKAVKAMPKWKPGKQNNEAARVRLVIPISFKTK